MVKQMQINDRFTFGKFEGLKLIDVFEYTPKVQISNYTFPDEVKRKNQEKWENAGVDGYVMEKVDFSNSEKSEWDHEELRCADWDYDPNNMAHDPSENPWIDVFGPGEEAEAAYWNTE